MPMCGWEEVSVSMCGWEEVSVSMCGWKGISTYVWVVGGLVHILVA